MWFRIVNSPHMPEEARRQLLHDIQFMGRGSGDPGTGLRDFEHDKLDRRGLNCLKKEVGRFKN